MMFKKLALASLISVAASGAYALEAIDEATLSETTGQAGLTIDTSVNITSGTLTYTDTNGFTGYTGSGDLLVNGLTASGNVTVDIDVGSDTTAVDAAALRLRIQSPTLTTGFSNISVRETGGSTQTQILSGATIALNNLDLAVELGNGPLAHLAVLNGDLGTITISNLAVNDSHAAGGGSILIGTTQLSGLNVNGTTVDVRADNAATAGTNEGGLVLTMGAGLNAVAASLTGIKLGDASQTAIGNVNISGLNLAGTVVTVRGH